MQPKKLLETVLPLQVKGLINLDKKLKTCWLNWPPEPCTTSDSEIVEKNVKAFKPMQGWLCFQSGVEYFCKNCKEKTMPYSGILLYGEVVNAEGESLHIRENGQGGWILTIFTETEGNKYLVETKEFLGEKKLAPEKLYYHVYWQYDEKHGYHQFAARFTGFKKEDNNSGK
ncbi:hypothetical protein [Candidatus Parabeggiatoa sp. HSG14]|uniref:hypothetical protein n=1 Tax=Candidatus Parabeggiatoa sp. HSG14 TaxID=3055593 RepID=UPI0025A72B62|nr:hypothetical protein [Thiotrichales bacterium HSG14]